MITSRAIPAQLVACGLLLLGALVTVSGCRTTRPSVDHATVLPGDVSGAIVVPDLSEALAGTNAIYSRFTEQFPDLEKLAKDLPRTVGFDFRDPESLKTIGINPKGGMGFAIRSQDTVTSISVSNASRFDGYLKEALARFVERPISFSEVTIAGRKGTQALIDGRETPDVVWVWERNIVHVCHLHRPMGSDAVGRLEEVIQSDSESRLDQQPRFRAIREQMTRENRGQPYAYFNYSQLDETAKRLFSRTQLSNLLKVGDILEAGGCWLGLGEDGMSYQCTLEFTEEGQQAWNQWKSDRDELKDSRKTHPVQAIEGDALAVLNLVVPTSSMLPMMKRHVEPHMRNMWDANMEQFKAVMGFGLDELMDQFTGRIGVAIYGVDAVDGLAGLFQGGDLSSFTPHYALYVQYRDEAPLRKLLEQGSEGSESYGTLLSFRPLGGDQGGNIWSLHWDGQKLGDIAIKDSLLMFTNSPQRLNKFASAGKGGRRSLIKDNVAEKSTTQAAQNLFSGDRESLGLYLSVNNVLRQFPIFYAIPMLGQTMSMFSELVISAELDGVTAGDSQLHNSELFIGLNPPADR